MADHAHQFHSKTYPSMVDLITERLNTFCNQHMQANDKLIVSSHIAHNGILIRLEMTCKYITLFLVNVIVRLTNH